MDAIPLWVLSLGTLIILYISIWLGHKTGSIQPEHLKKDKEKITSSNAAAILGLLGFVLVFSFGIVYSRYDSRKELVREEANLIRTAWLRSDFLPEQDRAEAKRLIMNYVDMRLEAVDYNDPDNIHKKLQELHQIQYQIWDMAVANARKDMNSDVAALYIESLNEMINIQAVRVAVGIQARIPIAIWVTLYLLMILGMFCVGYEASISSSGRKSFLTPIMVLSFSLMILLIASLDRPHSGIIRVSQQPIADLRNWMEESK